MSTCKRSDLQMLGYQPIMPKNLPDHFMKYALFTTHKRKTERSQHGNRLDLETLGS